MSNNTPTTSGGGFGIFGGGQTASPTAQSTSNLFGQATQSSNSGTASPFGAAQSNMFGSANTQSTGFGNLAQGNSNVQGSSGSNLFGGAGSSSSPFSFNKPADKPQDGGNGSNLFSTPNKTSSIPSQSSSLFGNLGSNQASSAPSGSATPTTTKAPFSFHSTTPAGNPPSTNLFGGLGQQENKGGSIFGASQMAPKPSEQSPQPMASNIFGSQQQTPSTQQSSTPLFGSVGPKPGSTSNNATSTPSQEPPKQSPFSFPSASSQQNATSNDSSATGKPDNKPSNTPPLSFGNASGATAQSIDQAKSSTSATEKSSMFAASNATASSKPTLFANPNQGQEHKNEGQGSSAPPSSGLFASVGQKTNEQKANPAPSTNLFAGIGQKKDTDSASNSQQATSAAAATSTSTTAANTLPSTSGNLFGGQSRAEQPNSSTQPVASFGATATATSTAPAATTATLGSSTSGPAPTAQSRLKNKSMDEIITRWASDLAKYQKEFQAQAEKVAEWDRMLLENGNTLARLYSRTFQAERDSAEVEKQISAVEGQQDELSLWLDRYEREVDEMMARQVGQGEGLQGPDQERERTYKTAERVSERLDEMGKELTSMIEEINDASTAVSKTSKPDDPLSQIVRVLNGHLSQLQLIDQGTAALQVKVTAAQQQSQRLGSRLHGGYNEAADSFSRSYLGKG